MQFGFRPNESSVDQLIAITHGIFTAFGANPSLAVCSLPRLHEKHSIEYGIKYILIKLTVRK